MQEDSIFKLTNNPFKKEMVTVGLFEYLVLITYICTMILFRFFEF